MLQAQMERRATAQETVAREEAVETMQAIATQQTWNDLDHHFVPVLKRLAKGNLVSARTSACGLFSRLKTVRKKWPEKIVVVLKSFRTNDNAQIVVVLNSIANIFT